MTLQEHHLETLRAGVLQEFTRDMSTCLIATTPRRLAEHARDWHWTLMPLNGVPAEDALVVQKQGFAAQLWVRHGVRRYRRLYLAYLQQHVDPSISEIGRDWQVDHLQASHRFAPGHPVYFVRMALVARAVNASYGAGFEKSFYSRERSKAPVGGFPHGLARAAEVAGRAPSGQGRRPQALEVLGVGRRNAIRRHGR